MLNWVNGTQFPDICYKPIFLARLYIQCILFFLESCFSRVKLFTSDSITYWFIWKKIRTMFRLFNLNHICFTRRNFINKRSKGQLYSRSVLMLRKNLKITNCYFINSMRFKLKIKISGFEINKKFEEFSNRINNIIYRGKKKTNTVIINSNKINKLKILYSTHLSEFEFESQRSKFEPILP
jgi:hypothetical protein